MLNKNSKIFLAGHKGMVGSAIFRALKKKKYKKIYTIEKKKLNLLHQNQVKNYFLKNKFDAVIIAAAKVGGILANMRNKPEFLYENLNIQNNIIHSSFSSNVKNLIFLGSSCIYPKNCNQPIKEKYLLSGPLEETNDAYAIAKIAGIKDVRGL
jgi:GDP-L-fucose synthase